MVTSAPRSLSVTSRRASSDAALALAAFYGAGGLLSLLSLLVPAWSGRGESLIAGVGVVATAVAAVLPLARPWLTRRTCYVLVILGSLLIGALMHAGAGGGASVAFAGFYVWVAVYSFLFFSPRGAAVQVVVALVVEIAALIEVGEGSAAPAEIILSAGTILATGAVVGGLSARLRSLTLTDELTGLPNRRSLNLTLDDRLTRTRGRLPVAVLGIDLDGFKTMNDTFGHAAGDRLLQEVATSWSAQLREGDVLARHGGDEFFAVLSDCDEERARAVAARMVSVVPQPVSACVGVVVVPGGTDEPRADIAELLADVDAALYDGKARGPGTVVVADHVPCTRSAQ